MTFINYLQKLNHSKQTIKVTERNVQHFKDWLKKENQEIEQVRYADLLNYLENKKGVTQNTKSGYLKSIDHYFEYLVKTEQIDSNPASRVKLRGLKRKSHYDLLDKKELESLYTNFYIPKEGEKKNDPRIIPTAERDKIIVGLMIYQGLKTEDLNRLELDDVKLREGKIFIRRGRRTNERELKLEPHQIFDLMDYTLKTRQTLLSLSGKTSNMFLVSTGKGASNSLNNAFTGLKKKLNKQYPKVTSYKQIRASVIVNWLRQYNLREVQELAGHRFISSTEAYQINDVESLKEDVMKYHPLDF